MNDQTVRARAANKYVMCAGNAAAIQEIVPCSGDEYALAATQQSVSAGSSIERIGARAPDQKIIAEGDLKGGASVAADQRVAAESEIGNIAWVGKDVAARAQDVRSGAGRPRVKEELARTG